MLVVFGINIIVTIKEDELHIPMNMNPVYQAVRLQTLTQAGIHLRSGIFFSGFCKNNHGNGVYF